MVKLTSLKREWFCLSWTSLQAACGSLLICPNCLRVSSFLLRLSRLPRVFRVKSSQKALAISTQPKSSEIHQKVILGSNNTFCKINVRCNLVKSLEVSRRNDSKLKNLASANGSVFLEDLITNELLTIRLDSINLTCDKNFSCASPAAGWNTFSAKTVVFSQKIFNSVSAY